MTRQWKNSGTAAALTAVPGASCLLWWIYLKNYCVGVRILVNLHVTLSNFEPLLRKFKYFITALINAEQLPL